MQGGDLSNDRIMRIAVSLDCILNRTPVIKKLLGVISYAQEEVTYDRQILSKLWKYSSDNGFILELVGFGFSQAEMQEFMDDLDNVVADLVAELPYRNELKGVIDVPQRALRYGSWYRDLWRV